MTVLRFSDVFDADEWTTRAEELRSLEISGVCFYTDGGYRAKLAPPNASWGLHAYFFKEGKPKKSSRYKGAFPTKEGYSDTPADKSALVTSLKIFNASDVIRVTHVTNNIAELQAFILAVDLILKSPLRDFIKTVRILPDSKYVLDNLLYYKAWKERGWKLSSGQPVLNLEYWKTIDEQMQQLEELDLDIIYKHVAGHVDHGNIIADHLCTLAMNTRVPVDEFVDEEWYLEKDVDLHTIFLEQRYVHFPGLTDKYQDFAYMYSALDTKISVSNLGCRLEDLSISIIKTTDEKSVKGLKLVHRQCTKLEEAVAPVPMVVELRNILNNKIRGSLKKGLIEKFDRVEEIDKVTIKNPTDDTDLVHVVFPPRNSFKLLDEYKRGVQILADLEKGEKDVTKTDITGYFYKETEKDGLKFMLQTEDSVLIPARHMGNDEEETVNVRLTIGLDLPRRRVLNNLATLNPKISVVTWNASSASFRFGVLVETDNSYGFWYSPYSNNQLI